MTWRTRENPCRAQPALFFPSATFNDDDELVEAPDAAAARKAKLLCASCPSRVPCLDEAVREGERFGIRGGQGAARRGWLRSQLGDGPEAYRDALVTVFAELDVWAGKQGAQREWQPASTCDRCDAPVKAGRWPADRNGPDATCGVLSTYNNGCRCVPCVMVKAVTDTRRPGR